MKNNNSNPKKFLETQELSALESNSVKGGTDVEVVSDKSKVKKRAEQ